MFCILFIILTCSFFHIYKTHLFQLYTKISSKVVGLLLAAKKRGLIYFEGEMLFQVCIIFSIYIIEVKNFFVSFKS